MVGNKIDLIQGGPNKKQSAQVVNPVTKIEAVNLARKYGMEYFESCSIGEASIV